MTSQLGDVVAFKNDFPGGWFVEFKERTTRGGFAAARFAH